METVERSALRHSQKSLRRLELPGLEIRLSGGQRACGLAGRVGGQRRRSFQKGRSGRCPAAGLRSFCAAFQVGRDAFIRFSSRESAVPRAAVGGEVGIARVRERRVRAVSFGR